MSPHRAAEPQDRRDRRRASRLDLDGARRRRDRHRRRLLRPHARPARPPRPARPRASRSQGDLETGAHHTVEDTGIVLGQALDEALGDRGGIRRYGHAVVPMDEARAACAHRHLRAARTAAFDGARAARRRRSRASSTRPPRSSSAPWRAAARLTLHLELQAGTNAHHMIEACFKAFARALRVAVVDRPRRDRRAVDEGDADVTVALVDYGMGNRRSVEKALEHVGARRRPDRGPRRRSRAADAIVLPGVGAFPEAMRRLRALGPRRAAARARGRRRAGARHLPGHAAAVRVLRPSTRAPRGSACCAGTVTRLEAPGLKIPHIGWNVVDVRRGRRRSPRGLGDARGLLPRAHVRLPARRRRATCVGRGEYGERFASIVERGNVVGVQFHPEKSSLDGLALLRNFVGVARGRMILYPAIDIRGGKAVRLTHGRFEAETVYHDDPLEAARAWVEAGARFLHVVDLDGAQGGRARVARPPRPDRGRDRRAGAVRRRAAHGRGGPRRAARRRGARDRRHRRAARRRLPRRRRGRLRAARSSCRSTSAAARSPRRAGRR